MEHDTKSVAHKKQNATCHHCGLPFACGRDTARCWCATLPVVENPLAGKDCLCKNCLRMQTKLVI